MSGIRAFLRRGKLVHEHSELEDFLTGRITREQGMRHIRDAVRAQVRSFEKLRGETLRGLRAWDLVYLDHIAAGRLVPGEPTAAAEPIQGLSANEALLVQHARSKRLLAKLPPIVQRNLQSLLKKLDVVWRQDAKQYDGVFEAGPVRKAVARVSADGARAAKKRAPKKVAKARRTSKPRRVGLKAGKKPGAGARGGARAVRKPSRKPARTAGKRKS